MKKSLLIIMLLPYLLVAQFKIDTLKSEGAFSKVYDITLSKEQLHQKSLEWVAINFKDANEVIKLNTNDKIISKGYFNIDVISSGYKFEQKVYFIMEVGFKENKYKVDFHTFSIHTSIQGNKIETPYNQYLSCLNKDSYISYLKSAMVDNPAKGIISDKRVNKLYTKILNDPKLIDEYMEKGVVFEKQVTTQIIAKTENLANNLFEYINKKSSEEW